MSDRGSRVHDQPAFVLHRHDWSETSLVLDLYTRDHGRVAVVAKGAKRPSSQFRPVLLPLQRLSLGWGGEGEVRTLKAAQWHGGHVMPTGDALLAGCYLNELLLRLLAREDPHPPLFDHYEVAVRLLAEGQVARPGILRAFELRLLQACGVLPALNVEGSALTALAPERDHRLRDGIGLQAVGPGLAHGLPGHFWLALHEAMGDAVPMERLAEVALLGAQHLQHQLRELLHLHAGVQEFRTRRLMLDAQALARRTRLGA